MSENLQKLENVIKPSWKANNIQKLQKHYRLDNDQNLVFYKILKHFLEEPNSLQDGQWDQDRYFYERFELVYGKKNCNINCEGEIIQEGVVATLDIYLKWREVENASLLNLQRVQNELRFLGVRNEKVDACFFLAKQQLAKEPSCGVHILCDDVVLLFSAKGKHEILVIYNDKKNAPICSFSVKREYQRNRKDV